MVVPLGQLLPMSHIRWLPRRVWMFLVALLLSARVAAVVLVLVLVLVFVPSVVVAALAVLVQLRSLQPMAWLARRVRLMMLLVLLLRLGAPALVM